MSTTSYIILGGDYERVGAASSGLKQRLKRLGAEPAAIRRALIAAYEAEANVVIHAHRGVLRATLTPSRIDVDVTDEGPGISDIELAMKEGYSTAPPAARQLGFGAGMGLPNIKKNSDSFAIQSDVGRGTRVRFSIRLNSQEELGALQNSLQVAGQLCRRCLRCLSACPVLALRVGAEGPEVLNHLCIDCTACIAACRSGALALAAPTDLPGSRAGVLVIPAAFLAQFAPAAGPDGVLRALGEIGFERVRLAEDWEQALRQACLAFAAERPTRPVFSPACPAVANLIQLRFPSLMGHLAPFLSPLEAAREELAGEAAVLAVACPSQHTVLRTGPAPAGLEVVSLTALRQAILPRVAAAAEEAEATTRGPERPDAGGVLHVAGMRHVLGVLEKAEDGLMGDFGVVELFACDQGCFGSPLLAEDPFLARGRWMRMRGDAHGPARAVRRAAPFVARGGMRLDTDMARAVEKLSRIDRLSRRLPGRDCAMCGAPTCGALAEDIVMGRATIQACLHLSGDEEESA